MKLHSDVLTTSDIQHALHQAQSHGQVAHDVYFCVFNNVGSRSRKLAYEIQLGAEDKTSGPTKSRHYKNRGTASDGYQQSVLAASYDEWGWFIAELFAIDPDAIFGNYKGIQSFNEQTDYKFSGLTESELNDNYGHRIVRV